MEENRVIVKTMEDVIQESMLPYSEYVILDRALPRVEDGLKPVQRRILYDMMELGLTPDKPYKKCARVVGDCLGKYHPHGDSSVYQALVRMAQPFNMGSTLVDGQGNFGDIDGNGAAAMRYTECRLTPLSLELLRDMGTPKDEIVKWSCNFDDTLKEPDILPGRYPNLLVNGASGIAVGLATNIPTHNLAETIDGVVAYIDNPKIKLDEMMKIIPGPDFPTGGYIIANELVKAYETGKGKIILKAKIHIEDGENDKKLIVVDELPYQVNRSALLESIVKIRDEKKGILMGISDITDESDRNGMRIVIKIKKDCDPSPILDILFKTTNLKTSFGINMVAIANGKPQQMGLLDIISYYANYQREFIVKRTKWELDVAKAREHIVEGLVIAVENIDEVVKVIKNSNSTSEARQNLRSRFDLSEKQADAILELRLARLAKLEVLKLEEELKQLREKIDKLQKILASKRNQMNIVKSEMLAIKKNFKTPRRSTILSDDKEYIVPKESDEKYVTDCVVAYTGKGNLKRMSIKHFNMTSKEFSDSSLLHEICSCVIEVKGDEQVFAFTNLGNCYKINLENIPEGRWREKGLHVSKIIDGFANNEKIIYMYPVGATTPMGNLLFYTRKGMVKMSAWQEYMISKSCFQAIKLKPDDEVIGMELDTLDRTLLFITKDGMSLNAEKTDIPLQGRISGGVKGIQLNPNDECVFAKQVTEEGEAVIITDKGFAKRVILSQLDVMARYRKGVKIIDLAKSKGQVIFASYVKQPYTIVVNVDNEYLTAFDTESISIENRTHTGRQLLKVKDDTLEVFIYNKQYTNGN